MEMFVSLAALITAVAAVVITLEQTKVMREEAELERKNARISVMPSVWLSTYIGEDDEEAYFKVVLTNKGLGPAVIERFDVSYKGQFVGVTGTNLRGRWPPILAARNPLRGVPSAAGAHLLLPA
jgi:hypothetical protein